MTMTTPEALSSNMQQAATSLELLVRGLVCGVIIAAPVGPVNVLCVQRTISRGWRSGLVSGLGSALADTLYGAIAGFGISFVIAFLIREEFRIRLYGGIVLIGIGVWYYFRRPQAPKRKEMGIEISGRSDWVSTFLLTLTNPTTVLSFLAVLAALGLGRPRTWWLTWFIVLGIFAGAMLWWTALTAIVNRLRDRFSERAMLWMNRAGGLAIGGFGIVTLLVALTHPR